LSKQRQLGTAITLIAAGGAAFGLITGHLSITVAVGIAVIGMVIGAGVARGNFSDPASGMKKK
jgi:hypothetical protein